jgi:uncharacterized NAD-dependent epimerase/dehydratase family protein
MPIESKKQRAVVYGENQLGKLDGKVTNGLVRHSETYEIVGVIDSSKAGMDAGEYLDGVKNGIPVYRTIEDALARLDYTPEYFIYGIAPLASFLDTEQRKTIIIAMQKGMNIVNGLPEFFSEDREFVQRALECGVQIHDVRKPPPRKDLHLFRGAIFNITTPVITVFGTDCAVGKRTSATRLVEALRTLGLKTVFIATGQTGLLQGARYGVAVDVLSSGFQTGEVEHEILKADAEEHPDIIVVEGQGALSHPAFTSSTAIIRGARPQAIILQHPPKRKNRCDFPGIPMPTLDSEIELIETVSRSKVIAITLNHEDMTDAEIQHAITRYEEDYKLPTTDVLKHGCDKIVDRLLEVFPELQESRLSRSTPPVPSSRQDSASPPVARSIRSASVAVKGTHTD